MAWCSRRLLFIATIALCFLELTAVVECVARLPSRVASTRIFPTRQRARLSSASSSTPKTISYFGGELYVDPHIYLIYYGNWSAYARNVTERFIHSINLQVSPKSVSSWWGVVRQYYQAVGPFGFWRRHVSPRVRLSGTVVDKYSRGKGPLTSDDVAAIINAQLVSKFPIDPKGIYFVLAAADVTTPGLCSLFCGYHAILDLSPSQRINYAFVSNVERCLGNCGTQQASPNGMPGVDAMINILAHELVESVTDPDGTGWRSPTYGEAADMCAWSFGSQLMQAKNASGTAFQYNMQGSKGVRYLVQQIWDRSKQVCMSQRVR